MADDTRFEAIYLYYYRARYYSARLGRFLQTDPIGNDDDIDLYSYVANDPQNFVDQSGAAKKWVASLVKLTGSGMREGAKLTKAQAVRMRQKGESILARSRQKAHEVEVAAYGKEDLIRHQAHQEGFRPHYQTQDKPGHSFWTVVVGSTVLGIAKIADSVAEAAESIGAKFEDNAPLVGDVATLADPISLLKSGDMPPPPGFREGPFGLWIKDSPENSGNEQEQKSCTGTQTRRDTDEPCPW